MAWKCPNCEAIVADHLRICSNCNWSPHVRRFGMFYLPILFRTFVG
jgi:hypothetical protein